MENRARCPVEREEVNPAPQTWSIHVLKGLSSFLDLRAEWDRLHARAALPHNVFQSHVFLRHWARHYADDAGQIIIVTAMAEGRLVMAWPLHFSRQFGVGILSLMGAPTAQFFDILVDPAMDEASLLDAGWNAVSALGADIFIARNLRGDAILRNCRAWQPAELPGSTTAPFATLSARVEGDGPGKAYSSRERSNYRRRLRRAAECGEIAFRTVGPGDKAAALAAKAVQFKQRSLLDKAVWSLTVSNPRFGKFFADLARDPDSSLMVSTIDCGGREIGIDLSFDCNGHTFGHVLATDPDCPAEGMGSVLVHRTFISAAMRGMKTFELMAPADPYKMQHADGETPVSNLAATFTEKGRLYRDWYLRKAQPLAKRAAQTALGPIMARMLRSRSAKT